MDLLRRLLKTRAPRPRKDAAGKLRRRRAGKPGSSAGAGKGRREMSNAEVVREALLRG